MYQTNESIIKKSRYFSYQLLNTAQVHNVSGSGFFFLGKERNLYLLELSIW